MALLHFDGFDSSIYAGDKPGFVGTSTSRVSGRYGGYARQISSSSFYQRLAFPASTQVIIGAACALGGMSTSPGSYDLLTLYDSTPTAQISIGLNSTGQLVARRGSEGAGIVIATATTPWPLASSAWQWLEVKASLDDTAGNVTVRVNGVEHINFTGDTRNSGTATSFGMLRLGYTGNGSTRWDDFYLCNNTGTTENDFLGEIKIEQVWPNGNGATNQWTGSDGDQIDNYLMHEDTAQAPTTYVDSTTPGARELYRFAPLLTTGTIRAVQLQTRAYKTAVGFASLRTRARSATGTETPGITTALGDAYGPALGPILTADPDGAAWTKTNLDNSQFGFELV